MDKSDITIKRNFGDENLEQLLIKLIRRELNSSSTRAEIREKLYEKDRTNCNYQPDEVTYK